ncbi:MAG: hypothetical protein KBD27_01105 [Candidatus Moranbacteria bacterium]|nr:hypothetical protein [Candidatus Moranbacteria bacterium]
MAKIYLLVSSEYYDGYVVYAASRSPIHYVGSIHSDGGSRSYPGVSMIEADETDVLRRRRCSSGHGWEISLVYPERREKEYEYKPICELLGRK